MQFKKHIRYIARVGQKATFSFAKRFDKKVVGHALIAAGTVAGAKYGRPAGALVGGALGHEIGITLGR